MDCHRCENLRYDGCPYGRCSHPGHSDVRLEIGQGREEGRRPYNRQVCPDFRLKRRCSNCKYWERGRYFSDGKTPAAKGKCSLDIPSSQMSGGICELWSAGPTSGKRRR